MKTVGKGGLFILGMVFFRFVVFLGFLFPCFFASLLLQDFCFSASLLFPASCFSASLLFCFFAVLLLRFSASLRS